MNTLKRELYELFNVDFPSVPYLKKGSGFGRGMNHLEHSKKFRKRKKAKLRMQKQSRRRNR